MIATTVAVVATACLFIVFGVLGLAGGRGCDGSCAGCGRECAGRIRGASEWASGADRRPGSAHRSSDP
jgi:hypothetical protein